MDEFILWGFQCGNSLNTSWLTPWDLVEPWDLKEALDPR